MRWPWQRSKPAYMPLDFPPSRGKRKVAYVNLPATIPRRFEDLAFYRHPVRIHPKEVQALVRFEDGSGVSVINTEHGYEAALLDGRGKIVKSKRQPSGVVYTHLDRQDVMDVIDKAHWLVDFRRGKATAHRRTR